ncbi:CD1247 N-terminal domain-containing protein [Clostridium sp.]|uniref:CD1247 N-terminal domain-containing protein n=1 Tax=Clostridium sp. TaxID=1506 RepID=UPI003464A7AC
MKEIHNRVSYIKGLMEGLELNKDSKEGKIFTEILNLIEELGVNMETSYGDLEEYIDSVDSELSLVKRDYYDFDDAIENMEEDMEEVEEEYSEVQCNNCNEIIYVEKNLMEDDNRVPCPCCQNNIILKSK